MTSPLRLGYNTNGFAHHRIADAIAILHEIGYRSVAVTLDHDLLDPPDQRGVARCVSVLEPILARTDLSVTIETGARFLLDPRRKHQPTLISARAEDRGRRLAYLRAAVDVAAAVSAECVSFWSGRADDDAGPQVLMDRLRESIGELLAHASPKSVRLAFEPEPGMFIETMSQYEHLKRLVDHPLFGLTLDIGHVHCLADGEPAEHIRAYRFDLWNVHIEDMRRGVHEHLPFGAGELDFGPVFAALKEVGFAGPLHVELPREAHRAVVAARDALAFLSRHL